MIFTPTKDQVRQFFCESRRKQRENLPLDGAEIIAADVIALHPEYHALLDDPEAAIAGEWTPEQGTMNPMLHLSLHLALFEHADGDGRVPGLALEDIHQGSWRFAGQLHLRQVVVARGGAYVDREGRGTGRLDHLAEGGEGCAGQRLDAQR